MPAAREGGNRSGFFLAHSALFSMVAGFATGKQAGHRDVKWFVNRITAHAVINGWQDSRFWEVVDAFVLVTRLPLDWRNYEP